MTSDCCTLFVGENLWHVGVLLADGARIERVAFSRDAVLDARIAEAKKCLAELGVVDQRIVLALPTSWCLCATISTGELERAGRRRAMGFRFEEHLPISAEDIVADYVDGGDGEALGVCGELERLQSIVAAIESAGFRVQHICPAAFLAAAHAIELHPNIAGVLLGDRGDEQIKASVVGDFIELHKSKPTHWWWLAGDEAGLRARLMLWAIAQDKPARLLALDCVCSPTNDMPSGVRHEWITLSDTSKLCAATTFAAKLLRGAASPWIDLRRDVLVAPDRYHRYRKPIQALVLSSVFMLACIIGVTQWRSWQYQVLSKEYIRQQNDIFKAVLPNQRVPGSISGRLLSEHQKLMGLGGQSAGGTSDEPLNPTSALAHLGSLLGALPTDVRYRILDVSIQPDLIRVNGQVRNHVDADRITASLRATGAYEVEPPKTQALGEGGMSFIFTATPHTAQLPKRDEP